MLPNVTVIESKAQKDEIIIEGIDIDAVSQSGEFYSEVNTLAR
jgi:ribosomal protein L6P/L9E